MRAAVARLLEPDSRFTVVGQAKDGLEAVRLADDLRPDVVTMDFNMPGLDGAEATRRIVARAPTPIVMLSAHTREGAAETLAALAAGAVDFVAKPDGEVTTTLGEVRDELLGKLIAAAMANVAGVPAPQAGAAQAAIAGAVDTSRRGAVAARPMPPGLRVVVVASSTGGPQALARVLPRLGLSGSALLVVQHMPEGFTAALATQLAELTRFAVREAAAGDVLAPGVALVAPGGRHLALEQGRVALSVAPPVHGVRPAADVTLRSVAQAFGARSVGVVLTGMGRDGALGLAAIKAAGGRTLAQDKASSLVYGMPKAAAELGVVDEVVPLDRMGDAIERAVR
ncbi:MAG: chemotaxis-specific protein-glutamate methyltransferase CheB [Polyangiaceae bacterium]|nr:chemotaxis-specific protein-glutamate methyltransferase CheB [Polyangiaceae bacterium]